MTQFGVPLLHKEETLRDVAKEERAMARWFGPCTAAVQDPAKRLVPFPMERARVPQASPLVRLGNRYPSPRPERRSAPFARHSPSLEELREANYALRTASERVALTHKWLVDDRGDASQQPPVGVEYRKEDGAPVGSPPTYMKGLFRDLEAETNQELVEIERGAQKLYTDQLQWGHIHSDDDPDDRGNDPAQQQHSALEEFHLGHALHLARTSPGQLLGRRQAATDETAPVDRPGATVRSCIEWGQIQSGLSYRGVAARLAKQLRDTEDTMSAAHNSASFVADGGEGEGRRRQGSKNSEYQKVFLAAKSSARPLDDLRSTKTKLQAVVSQDSDGFWMQHEHRARHMPKEVVYILIPCCDLFLNRLSS